MGEIRTLLSDYFEILEEYRDAKYLQSKYIPVSFNKIDSTKSLWEEHNKVVEIVQEYRAGK